MVDHLNKLVSERIPQGERKTLDIGAGPSRIVSYLAKKATMMLTDVKYERRESRYLLKMYGTLIV